MKYYQLVIVCILFVASVFFICAPVFSQPVTDDVTAEVTRQLMVGTKEAGYGESTVDPRLVVMRFVRIMLGLLGTLFVALFFLSGFWFVTSQGEEEKVTKAKKTMIGAVAGLLIILLAYSITTFVVQKMTKTAGFNTPAQPQFIQ